MVLRDYVCRPYVWGALVFDGTSQICRIVMPRVTRASLKGGAKISLEKDDKKTLVKKKKVEKKTISKNENKTLLTTIEPMVSLKRNRDEDPVNQSRKAAKTDGDSRISAVPASGRWWKTKHTEKFSMMQYKPQHKTLSKSWELKVEQRKKRQVMKEMEAEIKARNDAEKEAAKLKKLEKAKRKAENEMKNAKLQVITKTEKIKKMSKKQLRNVMKTQMDNDGNVQLVPLYQN